MKSLPESCLGANGLMTINSSLLSCVCVCVREREREICGWVCMNGTHLSDIISSLEKENKADKLGQPKLTS